MDKEAFMQEKRKAILEIETQQKELLQKCIKIASLKPAKRFTTSFSRASKVLAYSLQVKSLQIQKINIASQVNIDFHQGGVIIDKTENVHVNDKEFKLVLNSPNYERKTYKG